MARKLDTESERRYALEKANAYHEKAVAAHQSSLTYARVSGRYLRQLKDCFCYGRWLKWVDQNFKGKRRTAQIYMRIHRRWDELPKDGVESINQALRHLSPTRQAGKRFGIEDLVRSQAFKAFLKEALKDWRDEEKKFLKEQLPLDGRLQELIREAMEKVKLKIRREAGTLTSKDKRELYEPAMKMLSLRLQAQRAALERYEEMEDGTLRPRPLSELI